MTSASTQKKGAKVVKLPTARALTEAHREHLRSSGLSDERIAAGGFYSESSPAALSDLLGYRWTRSRGAGIVIPFFEPGKSDPHLCRVRPDKPRTVKKRGGKAQIVKYEQPRGVPTVPYFPAGSRGAALKDATVPLVMIEGEKKAAAVDQLGYCAIGGVGVSCFHDVERRAEHDEWRLHPWIREHVELSGRLVLIAFDSDAADNDQVMLAARRLAGMLEVEGARPRFVRIPGGEDNAKLGIDDYLVRFGEEATRLLLDGAEPIESLPVTEVYTLVGRVKALAGAPEITHKLRIPAGYKVGRKGELYKKEHDGPDEQIERSPILISRVLTGLDSGEKQVELCFHDGESWRSVMVGRRAIADGRTAIGELAKIGAPIDSNTSAKVITWLRDFEHVNAQKLERLWSVDRCGWHGPDRFMLDRALLAPEAQPVVLNRSGEAATVIGGLTTSGTLEGHAAALREAWEASPLCALAICSALAAPLLRLLSAAMFALHLYGDSSKGKSSMLKIAASLFGDPRSDDWIASWNSTRVGHEVRAALLSDLPLPIDEAGVADARERERAIYMLVNGVGRVRGAREGGLRSTLSWRTIPLSTGETMLAESSAATGAQVRVLQYRVDGFGGLDAASVDALRSAVEDHHGHAGRAWIQHLLKVEDWVPLRAQFKTLARQLQAQAPDSLAARRAGFFALLAMAEHLAHEALSLGQKNGATMFDLFLGESEEVEAVKPAADRAIDAVREWLAARASGFPALTVDNTGRKVIKGGRLPSEVLGYLDTDEVLILPGALRKMLAEQGISDRVVLSEWKARGWTRCHGKACTAQHRVGGSKVRAVVLLRDACGLGRGPDGGEDGEGGSAVSSGSSDGFDEF